MTFFLGAELYGKASFLLAELRKEFEASLRQLDEEYYGDELVAIAIISVIMPKADLDEGAYPERKLFKRKEKSADIRLHIVYEQFIKPNNEKRRELYISHIMDSIATLKKKLSKGYRYNELVQDVYKALTGTDLDPSSEWLR